MTLARGFLIAALLPGFSVSWGQSPTLPTTDPIATAKARQAVADQKALRDVESAIAEADRVASGNPAKAAQILRVALDGLDLSAAISSDARKQLVSRIQAKLSAIINPPTPRASKPLDEKSQAARLQREAVLVAAQKEAATIAKALADIHKDLEAGKIADARTKITALSRAYAHNPVVEFLQGEGDIRTHVAEASQLAQEQQQRVVMALRNVQQSALPATADMEFPKDWKERTAGRITEVKLTPREKEIIEALNAPMTLLANERPFEELLQEMSNKLNQEILVDPQSLQDAGLDLKKPVSVSGRNISARTLLHQILASQGLTYVVQDEVIKVVTVDRARNMLVTRVYYLGDLITPFGGDLRWGPFLNYELIMANAAVIIESIMNSVEPQSWKDRGGAGTITFHFPSLSLIVRASTEVHALLGSKLGRSR